MQLQIPLPHRQEQQVALQHITALQWALQQLQRHILLQVWQQLSLPQVWQQQLVLATKLPHL